VADRSMKDIFLLVGRQRGEKKNPRREKRAGKNRSRHKKGGVTQGDMDYTREFRSQGRIRMGKGERRKNGGIAVMGGRRKRGPPIRKGRSQGQRVFVLTDF